MSILEKIYNDDKKAYIDEKEVLVAKAYAITSVEEEISFSHTSLPIYEKELSEEIGEILVSPIYKEIGIIKKEKVLLGYVEVLSRKPVVKHTYVTDSFDPLEIDIYIVKHDATADIKPKIGDIEWKIDPEVPAIIIKKEEELKEYYSNPPIIMDLKIDKIREKGKEIAQDESNKSIMKH